MSSKAALVGRGKMTSSVSLSDRSSGIDFPDSVDRPEAVLPRLRVRFGTDRVNISAETGGTPLMISADGVPDPLCSS